MGGKSSGTTAGYKYYAGFQMVLARYVHKLYRIRVDQKIAWSGEQSAEGIININAPSLFGDPKSADPEGGVVGDVNFQPGLPTQMPDSYLRGKIGQPIPASRGASALVAHQIYLGNNPYMKDWDVRAERIHQLDDGTTQWYDEKAEIVNVASAVEAAPGGWDYILENFTEPNIVWNNWTIPTSGWNTNTGVELPVSSSPSFPDYIWTPTRTNIWLRRQFTASTDNLTMGLGADNGCVVFVDGVQIGTNNGSNTPISNNEGNPVFFPIPTTGVFTVVVKAYGEIDAEQDTGNILELTITGKIPKDMNPAHMLRECLLNGEWGYGYDVSDIDDTMFRAVADTLYSENLGLSYFWDDANTEIGDVIENILAHIDGQLYVDRQTQLWSLVLIRADYDVATLPEFSEGVEIISMEDFARPGFMDLINEVTVSFYDFALSKSSTITLPNSALFLQQGVKQNKQNDYNMCCNSSLASRLCSRDLRTESTPLATGTVYLIPTAQTSVLHRGSVCKLTFSKCSLFSLPVRVTGISFGDGASKRIKMSFTEDVFALPETVVTPPGQGPWVDPGNTPSPITNRMVTEVPYAYLLKAKNQTDLDRLLATSPELGYIAAAAARPGNALNAFLYVDSGAGYETHTGVDFCAFGKLATSIERLDSTFTLDNMVDIDEAVIGSFFQIGNEIMSFTGISAGVMTGVTRGLFDTVPALHYAGDGAFFIENYLDSDGIDYAEGEAVDIKLVTVTSIGSLPLSDSPMDILTLAARAISPYPPGKVQIGGTPYPSTVAGAFVVTWADRNRVTQATQLVDTTMGTVTPEVNTRYVLRFLDSTNTLLVEQTNIGPGTATVVLNYTGTVTMQLYSVTDNGRSIQQHEFTFAYTKPSGTVVSAITATAYTHIDDTTIISGGSL